jgi:conjugative transfer signal peptidase TraF
MKIFKRLFPLLSALGFIMLVHCAKAGLDASGLKLVINLTDSIPHGIYKVFQSPNSITVGTLILFDLPRKIRKKLGSRPWLKDSVPFLKPVGAVAGQEVCIRDDVILIDAYKVGTLTPNDYEGLPLPQTRGCYILHSGQVLPLSTSKHSFDGRYFGAIETEKITGMAIPLFIW